ncbi:pseudouridine synthase [Neisseria arctica]|uniref:Pseudouridine synthase n=1 Tax=Neisseria arctica TaxID=1470200 RepID=A0A0J1C143_9NEIS|nr:TIGR01621 family pseudouridine synthase [Neisseria arctica]KLT71978.1 pseudouridine synthase [Neisseria arctica]UOO86701.1 TIGR01621 family pseudouridine synthase [Neisseria arctica]
MEFEVLYRHTDFIAINKPIGIAVHQSEDTEVGLTTRLAAQIGVPRIWLVHRLDKTTSGVLLLALNKKAASLLAEQFALRHIQKTYLALSTGKPIKKQGWVKGDMEKSRRSTWKLIRSHYNPAVTHFCSRSVSPGLRLFVLYPKTGKTHQLRVAMKSLGSPILGDTLYGGASSKRLFLHAWRLKFEYLGQTYFIYAPWDSDWPEAMANLLSGLGIE